MVKPLDELITDLLRPIFPELRSEELKKLVPIMRVALRICAIKAGVKGMLDK